MVIPYNSPDPIFATKRLNSAADSQFVVAIRLAGIETLPGFLYDSILLLVFSAAEID